MPDKSQLDILIIGSGEAGKYLAWTMAKAGRRTAVVERALIGGSCPNIACLPSKNIIHSAKVAELTRRAAEFGIAIGPVTIDMAGVRARKRQMVDGLINLHLDRYKASGAELILGEARFVAPRTVEVKSKDRSLNILSGDQVFLNVGTRAAIPDVPGLKAAMPLTHIEALELDRVPEHLIVLGRDSKKPVLLWSYTRPAAVCVDLLSEAGLPLFTNVHNCARAMRVMADYRSARAAFVSA